MKHSLLALIALCAMSTQSFAQTKVKNVYASNAKLNIEQLQSQEQTVQLNRYFFAGYNTLCLPMSLTADQVAAAAKGLRVERLVGIKQEGSVVNLYFVDCTADGIQAGMPYLVYSPTAQYLRVRNTETMGINAELKSIRLSDSEGNQVTFGSSWESIQKDGRYGIPAQQGVTPLESVLVRTEADKTFLPTRCGFTWDEQSGTANELQIQHAASFAEVTAIMGVEKTFSGSETYYDLNGRKMNGQLRKGVYVVDGGKVVLK